MITEHELEAKVDKELSKTGLKYWREHIVGDTQPDFVVDTGKGNNIVIEVKNWQQTTDNISRAVNQANRYKEFSKAAAALIVTATGTAAYLPTGAIAPISVFTKILLKLIDNIEPIGGKKKMSPPNPSPKKKIFASMPFAGLYDDTFLVAIQPAAVGVGAVADRVDHTGRAGDVVQQIKQMIKESRIVVADLSESRPNVCHEVGYAEAIGRPVVQICSTPLSKIPFNLRNNATLSYSIGQASKFRNRLSTELKKII